MKFVAGYQSTSNNSARKNNTHSNICFLPLLISMLICTKYIHAAFCPRTHACAQVVTKKRPKLGKRFKCPFCANDDTVECKMDLKVGVGSLACRLCGASYQMPIHHLHEPVDVFSEWLDDCEHAANNSANNAQNGGAAAVGADDGNDDLPESSGLGRQQQNRKPKAKKNSSNERSIALGDNDSDDGDDDDDDDI
jgi:transcription elongation factor Elf1